MRLAGQQKGGFYAIPPEAIQQVAASRIAKPLTTGGRKAVTILDPCAGRGEAIRQWAEILGVPMEHTYAIELEDGRADEVRETLPGANILAPCSAFGCSITPRSISLLHLNPPFDDSIGGGSRVEAQFLSYATSWLAKDGVLCFVCPEKVAYNTVVRNILKSGYADVQVLPFPAAHRPFNEVFILARKTGEFQHPREVEWTDIALEGDEQYQLPLVVPPDAFRQTELTETQLSVALKESPLRAIFTEPPKPKVSRPPLELGVGHIALLLSSGHLDGLVEPEGEPPHVVRGTCRKSEQLADVVVTEESTKEIYRERIEMVVRTVDVLGQIKTFGSLPAADIVPVDGVIVESEENPDE